ncbi:MAG: hypothetical protein EYC62_04990 [Alphaproteobacteria bacterium]|nr:MAG: hypothetical protein EYC62_04990 [Alphaproteobacteria bacterium]
MSLTINSNQTSTIALRALQRSQNSMERALARLSSGQNAPSARYDAAGIAVSSRIRGEIVALQKYQQNAQQAVSMLQIAEGSYQRAGEILNRMRSLATQSQSSNLSSTERGMLDTEYQALKSEMARLARSVKFNQNDLFAAGNISFASGVTYTPTDIVAAMDYDFADINGDGIKDMITTSNAITGVRVFLGLGDGTFNTTSDYAINMGLGAVMTNVTVGDFNGDGRMDILANGTNGAVTALNNGDGTFAIGTIIAGGATNIVTGDFNGDGELDYAIASGTSISIRLNDGTGLNFSNATFIQSITASSMVAGDMNNDGILDLAINNTAGQFIVMQNDGGGNFTSGAASGAITGSARFSSLSDIDGDGFLDVVVGDTGNLWYLRNTGNGTFAAGVSISMGAASQRANYAYDINGDGYLDLISSNSGANFGFRQGYGGWNYGSYQSVTSASGQNDIVMRDLNNDGLVDAIVRTNTQVIVYMNTSTTGLQGSVRVSSASGTSNNVAFRTGSMNLNVLDYQMSTSMINSRGTALRAEQSIKRAIDQLGLFRSSVAASINRLEKTQDNIANMLENQEGARSAIADLDVAREMTEYTAQKIMQQAGIAMLTQANKTQSIIAKLLELSEGVK